MLGRRLGALLLALVVAGPAGAAAPPSPLERLPDLVTLDDALRLFRAHGLDLLIADAAVRSAEGDARAAASIPNPVIGGSVAKSFFYDPSLCAGCSDLAWSASLSDNSALMDTASGRRHLRIEVAEAALKAARLNRADAQRLLELQLKQQYISAVFARDSLDFALEVQKAMTRMLELNQVRYKAGAISEADVAKVETDKLEADQDVDRATQDLRTAKIGIAFLLGVRGPVPEFKVAQDLPRFAIPRALAGATVESLLAEAMARRPDLKALSAQERRAALSITAARRDRVPDLALSVQATGEGSGNSAVQPPTFGLGVTMTLPLFYQFQGEVMKAEADLRTQTLTHARVEAQVVNEVESAWAAFTGSQKRVERMESRMLDRARRARDLVEIQYQKGAASLLEYLDAQRTYISSYVEYLRDLADYWTAVYQLEAAVGMELRE